MLGYNDQVGRHSCEHAVMEMGTMPADQKAVLFVKHR